MSYYRVWRLWREEEKANTCKWAETETGREAGAAACVKKAGGRDRLTLLILRFQKLYSGSHTFLLNKILKIFSNMIGEKLNE